MSFSGSYKYLYERLGEKRFQQLCGALLVNQFGPDVAVFPVGEKDGGRDMTVGQGRDRVVYQVKFSSTRSKKPASWLVQAVKGETANIRRLAEEGLKEYVLMTNVEGSAAPTVGTRDLVADQLGALSRQCGVPISCRWSSDLDAYVDNAPSDLKLSYVDMLVGHDALLALLRGQNLQDRERRVLDLLQAYVAVHWGRDMRVKFKQVDLKSDLLVDLFVDVSAIRARLPQRVRGQLELQDEGDVGGIAGYLLSEDCLPMTLVEGVPGQGKSTAVQYVCQVHRAEFLGHDVLREQGEAVPKERVKDVRVPIRIDLVDYAEWLQGGDPFSYGAGPRTSGQRKNSGIEQFLVAHFREVAPGHRVTLATVHEILERYPTQVVFDGLDEVASQPVRQQVVTQIEEFASRWVRHRPGLTRVVVTTRPNDSGLPEPDVDLFEKAVLQPLSEDAKMMYLRRWMRAQGIENRERGQLESVFTEQVAAPHVAQLAENPMQLTILLHLIWTKGDSLPRERTMLYRSYMDLFLEREAVKSDVVREHRSDLEEATAFVAWLMQTLSEVDSSSSRLSRERIVRAMKGHLAMVEKKQAPVGSLFEAMRDRVWVLTSKHSGSYEFEVQTIREFFAARFLYDFAQGQDELEFDPAEALVEMLPRAYWLNTARFLAGHFRPNQIPNVAELIEGRFEDLAGARQVRAGVWSLLSDGVFKARPKSQRKVAGLLADDLSVRFAVADMEQRSPGEALSPDSGGEDLAEALRNRIEGDVGGALSPQRSQLAVKVGNTETHAAWWRSRLDSANEDATQAAWLAVGVPFQGGLQLPAATVASLSLSSPEAAQAAISAGVTPAENSQQAKALTQWVLDGHCSDSSPAGNSEAADLLRLVAPHAMIRLATESQANRIRWFSFAVRRTHYLAEIPQQERTDALRRLERRSDECRLRNALREGKGQKGTTSRWVNTARTLTEMFGRPSWLATEIAAIGAGSEATTGGDLSPDAPCLGPDMDYGQWVPAIRRNRNDKVWWTQRLDDCNEPFSKATWILGLLVTATPQTFDSLIPVVQQVAADLPEPVIKALTLTSSRLSQVGLLTESPAMAVPERVDPSVRLLCAHRSTNPTAVMGRDIGILQQTARYGAAAWPAYGAASIMSLEKPSKDILDTLDSFEGQSFIYLDGRSVGNIETTLDSATCRDILSRSAKLPRFWLESADRTLVEAMYGSPLKNFADTRWGI